MQDKKKNQTFKNFNLDESPYEIELEFINLSDFFKGCSDNPFNGHTHSYYQIIWFQKGEGVHYVAFKEYPVKENTLFFISPGQIHHFERNTCFEGVMIHFSQSFLTDDESSENIFLKYNLFNAFDSVPYFTITHEITGKLHYLTDELHSEIENTDAFAYCDYLKYLIKMFLIHIQRNGIRDKGEPLCITNQANRTFVKFRQLLELNYRHNHTVKEYASMLNISSKTLTNSVAESSSFTPLKLINERLVLEAKRQLLYSALTSKEIAFRLGFEDPSYFVKFFKRQTGYLPTSFRKQKNN